MASDELPVIIQDGKTYVPLAWHKQQLPRWCDEPPPVGTWCVVECRWVKSRIAYYYRQWIGTEPIDDNLRWLYPLPPPQRDGSPTQEETT